MIVVAAVSRIVVQEGQQTDVPCITEHPAFNKTNNVLKVWWFHQKQGRSLISNPFYTIDLTSSNQVNKLFNFLLDRIVLKMSLKTRFNA